MHNPPVEEIMTRDVVAIAPELGVDVAVELMGANAVRRLPVVSQAGRLVGIITLAEADKALAGPMRDAEGFNRTDVPKVRDVMTANVITIGPREPLGLAARRMVNHKIGALPVLEDGRLVGILTESDIFRYVAGLFEAEASTDHPAAG